METRFWVKGTEQNNALNLQNLQNNLKKQKRLAHKISHVGLNIFLISHFATVTFEQGYKMSQ